jgi:signal transduction histidine kinase
MQHLRGRNVSFILLLVVTFCLYICQILLLPDNDLRCRLEDILYDQRSMVKPYRAPAEEIVVVTIGDGEIETIQGNQTGTLDENHLAKLIEGILHARPRALALVLPQQDYAYNSKKIDPLLQLLNRHKNFYLGIFDFPGSFTEGEDLRGKLPFMVEAFPRQVLSADTQRRYKNEVIRHLPVEHAYLYGGKHLRVPHLMVHLARTYGSASVLIPAASPMHQLNYFDWSEIPHFSALSIGVPSVDRHLHNAIVLLGFSNFRGKKPGYSEGTYGNTPWEGDSNPEQNGTALVDIFAVYLSNLLQGSCLREVSFAWNVLQIILCSSAAFYLWLLPPSLAVLSLLGLGLLVFTFHSYLFAYGSIFLPLADTAMFSVICTCLGAVQRTQRVNKKRLAKQLAVAQQRKITQVHDRFLDRFAFVLADLNTEISALLPPIVEQFNNSPHLLPIAKRITDSSEELREYLAGLKNYTLIARFDHYRHKKILVDLGALIDRILAQFSLLIHQRNLKTNLLVDSSSQIKTDPFLLEAILFNLLGNALKYSPEQGTVAIAIRRTWWGDIEIIISDQGPGIAKDQHEKIFEKFYRVPGDESFRVKGHGLGLYLCRFFAHKISAVISLQSSPGKGAHFYLRLPGFRL